LSPCGIANSGTQVIVGAVLKHSAHPDSVSAERLAIVVEHGPKHGGDLDAEDVAVALDLVDGAWAPSFDVVESVLGRCLAFRLTQRQR